MTKILAITWKELYTTFTDRNLILIMIITPLALASIIGTAFSGFIGGGGSDVPVRNIPLALVNQDQAVEVNGTATRFGQTFVDLLIPADPQAPDPADNALLQLTDATLLEDAAAARAGVDSGTYNVALIIPPDFTRSLTYTQDNPAIRAAPVEVYASPTAPVSASIVRSIAENIAQTFLAGSVTVAATIDELVAQARQNPVFGLQFLAASQSGSFQPDFASAFQPESAPITLERQTVTGTVAGFNPLVLFGSAQALFFMTFTAIQGANSMLEERRDWTLQRLLASPTPRITILLGKLIGTLVTCIFQVILLFIFLTLVGSLIGGRLQLIWGDNLLAVLAVIGAASLALCGFGAVITALARSPEQVNILGGVVAILFGLFSGAFFNVQAIPQIAPLSRFTPNYWGIDAFTRLAQGSSDILPNLVVLVVMGVVLFAAGLLIFNRRLGV
jgi:ABC-2 type transport system permease protein